MDRNRIPLSEALEGFFIAANARRLSRHTLRDYDTTFRETVHQGANPVTNWALQRRNRVGRDSRPRNQRASWGTHIQLRLAVYSVHTLSRSWCENPGVVPGL